MSERMGHYELGDELGTGGMGTVWRARDTRTGATVAVKLLHPHLAKDADYLRRFQREAKIARGLRSPQIVPVLDYGQEGSKHFLVMEYVEGKSLADVLKKKGKLPVEQARSVTGQVAEALDVAHRQGVVHRDIKPGNILIDKDGVAKVSDFGIARAADTTSATQTGIFLGTARYAAPEVFSGKADIRSDI